MAGGMADGMAGNNGKPPPFRPLATTKTGPGGMGSRQILPKRPGKCSKTLFDRFIVPIMAKYWRNGNQQGRR
jgi:hypothetical protein